jgi:hypothetical protein
MSGTKIKNNDNGVSVQGEHTGEDLLTLGNIFHGCIVEGPEKVTRWGGGEWEPIKNSLRGELGLYPGINPMPIASNSTMTT